jgi:hypothetical protein
MLMRKTEQRTLHKRPHLLFASKQRKTLSAAYLTTFLVEEKLEQYDDFQHFTVLQCRRAATLDCRTVYSVLSDCTIHHSTPK